MQLDKGIVRVSITKVDRWYSLSEVTENNGNKWLYMDILVFIDSFNILVFTNPSNNTGNYLLSLAFLLYLLY